MKENNNTDQGLVCKQNKGPVADIHPIKTGNYTIPTDEMFSLYEYMCTAIDISFDGSIIYGNAYTGKSYAIRQLTTWFEEKRNQKHATYRISLSNKVYSYKEFFQYISEQIGCASDGRRLDSERVAEHLINALIFYGHMHGDKIVLILDEAETLQVTHYKSLKYLFNRLSDAKIKLVTFLVGTEALLNSREVFETPDFQEFVKEILLTGHFPKQGMVFPYSDDTDIDIWDVTKPYMKPRPESRKRSDLLVYIAENELYTSSSEERAAAFLARMLLTFSKEIMCLLIISGSLYQIYREM